MDHDSYRKDTTMTSAGQQNTQALHEMYDEDITVLRRMLKQQEEPTDRVAKSFQEVKVKAELERTVLPKSEKTDRVTHQPFYSNVKNDGYVSLCSCDSAKELLTVRKERDELKVRFRRGEASRTTITERQELERALHSAKSELFQEQKRFRHRIEDLEDRLEEAQYQYEEALAEKNSNIQELQDKLAAAEVSKVPASQTNNDAWVLKEKTREQQEKMQELQSQISQKDREIDALHFKIKDQSRLSENISHQLLENERKIWRGKLQEAENKLSSAKEEQGLSNKRFESENKLLRNEVEDFKKKNDEISRKLEESTQEHEKAKVREHEQWLEKENDLKDKNHQLQEKIENFKLELSQAFSKNSHLEIDIMKREKSLKDDYMARVNERREEVKDLHQKIENLQLEVADALLKAKTSVTEGERLDHCISSTLLDLCHKLALLHNAMEPNDALRLMCSSAGVASSKEAVAKLENITQQLSRKVNEQICELERLRRHAKRPAVNQLSSLRSNSDVDCLSEELKLVRGRLQEKEDELRQLQVNMEHWKELTAKRLAQKFQEELQLQMEKKLTQNRDSGILSHAGQAQYSSAPRSSLSNVNDSSTVKLLCHLQSRVKQLRTENDLLRSSSFIKELGK